MPGTQGIPPPTRLSLRRAVRVLAKGKVVGTVAVTLPLDGDLLSRLRTAAPLGAGEGIVFVRGDHVLARTAGVPNARLPPQAQSVRLGGSDYRVVQTTLVRGPTPVRLAAVAPDRGGRQARCPLGSPSRRRPGSDVPGAPHARAPPGAAGARPTRKARARRAELGHGRPDELAQPARLHRGSRGRARSGPPLRQGARSRPRRCRRLQSGQRHLRPLGRRPRPTRRRRLATRALPRDRRPRPAGWRRVRCPVTRDGLSGAQEAAERFVTALAGSEFGEGRNRLRGITASAGIAAAADREIEVLLEAADRALYGAKKHGKNQVKTEEPPEP